MALRDISPQSVRTGPVRTPPKLSFKEHPPAKNGLNRQPWSDSASSYLQRQGHIPVRPHFPLATRCCRLLLHPYYLMLALTAIPNPLISVSSAFLVLYPLSRPLHQNLSLLPFLPSAFLIIYPNLKIPLQRVSFRLDIIFCYLRPLPHRPQTRNSLAINALN